MICFLFLFINNMVAQEVVCNDRLDNDKDGLVDCLDVADCSTAAVCSDERFFCNDGKDNDGNNKIDCADNGCMNDPTCVGCANAPLVWNVDVYDLGGLATMTGALSVNDVKALDNNSRLLARTKLPYLSLAASVGSATHFESILYPIGNLAYLSLIGVRAVATIPLIAGKYVFGVKSDDGFRLAVDGFACVESDKVMGPIDFFCDFALESSRNVTFSVLYFNAMGGGMLEVFFTLNPTGKIVTQFEDLPFTLLRALECPSDIVAVSNDGKPITVPYTIRGCNTARLSGPVNATFRAGSFASLTFVDAGGALTCAFSIRVTATTTPATLSITTTSSIQLSSRTTTTAMMTSSSNLSIATISSSSTTTATMGTIIQFSSSEASTSSNNTTTATTTILSSQTSNNTNSFAVESTSINNSSSFPIGIIVGTIVLFIIVIIIIVVVVVRRSKRNSSTTNNEMQLKIKPSNAEQIYAVGDIDAMHSVRDESNGSSSGHYAAVILSNNHYSNPRQLS